MVEGATLEMLCRGNSTVSSNLTLSAIFILKLLEKVPFGAIFNGIPAKIPIFRLYPGINGRRMKIWLLRK